MSRQEFLQRLRDALLGEVPSGVLEENIRYYNDYISTEAGKGQTEEEVTSAIGDPRLIAKTIIDATENAAGTNRTSYTSGQYEDQSVYQDGNESSRNVHFVDLSKWYWKLLAVVVTVLFFFLVASIVTGIFSLLIPFLGPLLVILFVLWIFRSTRR